jgi:uncharacterized protein YbaP (TraB family)
MTPLWRALLFVAVIMVGSGCSTHRMAEKTRFPLHPIQESRMTNRPTVGYVATGVWRVRGAANTVYLAAASHLVATNEIPFPSSYYAAYQDVKEVWVEADPLSFYGTWLVASMLPSATVFLVKNISEFTCPKGRTLADYVSPDTARRLREHYGKDYANKARFMPLGLLFMNEFSADTSETVGGPDDLFALLAHRDSKPIHSLDNRTAAQLAVPAMKTMLDQTRTELSKRGADDVVKEKILEHKEERDDWRYGDVSAAAKEMAEMKSQVPTLYAQLLPERNQRWLRPITHALAGKRNVLVIVGALHLAGEDGLIELLRKAGYHPEQMYGIDRPTRK